jgi:hypothetical protein
MIHDLQASALFLFSFRDPIRSAAIVPRLTAFYIFPRLSSNATPTVKSRIPKRSVSKKDLSVFFFWPRALSWIGSNKMFSSSTGQHAILAFNRSTAPQKVYTCCQSVTHCHSFFPTPIEAVTTYGIAYTTSPCILL